MKNKTRLLVLLIGVYPYLQAIGFEYPVWVYPTLEKGEPRSKLSKYEAAAFVVDIVLDESFWPSL